MKTVTITAPVVIGIALAFALSAPVARAQTTIIDASAPVNSSISPDVPQTTGQIQQWRGQHGDEKAHTEVFNTQEAWAKLWKHLGFAPREPLNEKTQMAVCIYIGERSTAGFRPYIISAVERDGKMVVSYSTGAPAPQQMVAEEITHPWVAAIIPKSTLPIVFKEI